MTDIMMMMKKFEIVRELMKMCPDNEVSKRCWENGTYRPARCGVATDLQCVQCLHNAVKQRAIKWGVPV